MMRNPREIERAKRKHEREHPLTLEQKYALLNLMYAEVKLLGRLTSKGAGDKMKQKIALARILNAGV